MGKYTRGTRVENAADICQNSRDIMSDNAMEIDVDTDAEVNGAEADHDEVDNVTLVDPDDAASETLADLPAADDC